jgi:hypothetical protein
MLWLLHDAAGMVSQQAGYAVASAAPAA